MSNGTNKRTGYFSRYLGKVYERASIENTTDMVKNLLSHNERRTLKLVSIHVIPKTIKSIQLIVVAQHCSAFSDFFIL